MADRHDDHRGFAALDSSSIRDRAGLGHSANSASGDYSRPGAAQLQLVLIVTSSPDGAGFALQAPGSRAAWAAGVRTRHFAAAKHCSAAATFGVRWESTPTRTEFRSDGS